MQKRGQRRSHLAKSMPHHDSPNDTSRATVSSYGTFHAHAPETTKATDSLENNTSVMTSHDEERHEDFAKVGGVTIGSIAGEEARQGTEHEHRLSLMEALRLYPTAVGWSIYFSLGVIMASFDPQLLGNLYATPAFQRDFGYLYNGEWIISAPWQTGLSMGSPIGQVVGAFFASYPMEWFGRKKTFGACVVITAGFVFIQFFARSLPVLLAGELLGGLILGTYVVDLVTLPGQPRSGDRIAITLLSMNDHTANRPSISQVAPAYASEVCPVALRGILTSWINLSFVTGQLIANGVIAGTSQLDNHWAYSAPFAAQWVWPLIILVIWPFAPESPWWLVRKGQIEQAEHSLRRLASETIDVKPTLAMIIETDKLEHTLEAGSTYRDCFKPINLRRTEISIGVYTIQGTVNSQLDVPSTHQLPSSTLWTQASNTDHSLHSTSPLSNPIPRKQRSLTNHLFSHPVFSGIYLVGYATYFFELAGLATSHAFAMGVGFLALGFVGTCCSWILLSHFGRRKIYNTGLAALIILLLTIGIIDCAPSYSTHPALAWTQSSLMLVWNFIYDLSVGPVCFVLICETSATRVRSKTIALATAAQALVAIAMTVAIPYLINPDQANGRGKIGFFFGGLSLLSLVWAWFRVPETKGRTYEELDIMFSRGVRTREFKTYRVE
ncbi:hypothetical protein Q7P37_000084 [Cladosporium fusiforme]